MSMLKLYVLICGLIPGLVFPQAYPTKPVTMVIPFAAGGPTDTLGRNLALAWGRQLKQTVIVENLSSAGGIVAVARVAHASPDGYQLLLHHIGMSTAPALYRKLDFDPLTDFEYIGLVADVPMTLVARSNFPAANLKEVLAYIKANNTKVTLANAGVGAASHLCGLLFMSAIQTDFLTVPYKGTAPAVADTMTGQVQFVFSAVNNVLPQMKAGKLKVLAVLTPQRFAPLPDIPSVAEALPGYERPSSWYAFFGPAGMPPAVTARISSEIAKQVHAPEMKSKLEGMGLAVIGNTPQEFSAMFLGGFSVYERVIKAAGIQPE